MDPKSRTNLMHDKGGFPNQWIIQSVVLEAAEKTATLDSSHPAPKSIPDGSNIAQVPEKNKGLF